MVDDIIFKMKEFTSALERTKILECKGNEISVTTEENTEKVTFNELEVDDVFITMHIMQEYEFKERHKTDILRYSDTPMVIQGKRGYFMQTKLSNGFDNETKIKLEDVMTCELVHFDEGDKKLAEISCLYLE